MQIKDQTVLSVQSDLYLHCPQKVRLPHKVAWGLTFDNNTQKNFRLNFKSEFARTLILEFEIIPKAHPLILNWRSIKKHFAKFSISTCNPVNPRRRAEITSDSGMTQFPVY